MLCGSCKRATQHNISEDTILLGHLRKSLKSYIEFYLLFYVVVKVDLTPLEANIDGGYLRTWWS
jgi:hypothetical protein